VVAGEVGQDREHRGVGGAEPVQQQDRRRVGRSRLQVGGADAHGEDLLGPRELGRPWAARDVVLGEQPVELQRQRQVAPHREVAGQEGHGPGLLAAHHRGERGERALDHERRRRGGTATGPPAPAADLDGPDAGVARVEHDRRGAALQHRALEAPPQPSAEQRVEVGPRWAGEVTNAR
jgi:hypothetical protein